MLTYEEKVWLYTRGHYSVKVPPVCSSGWGRNAWINHISLNGVWWVSKLEGKYD